MATRKAIFTQIVVSLSICFGFISPLDAQTVISPGEITSKTASASRIVSPIRLDGSFSEACWDSAAVITGFTQREPHEGEPATEKTEVKIIYDNENMYVGVICYDSEPDLIIHNELQVDGYLEYDDNFTFILDTFNDKRGGFYFRTNPNGARLDAKIGGGGSRRSGAGGGAHTLGVDRRVNYDWNGIWDVAARITEDGWVAEIIIPLSTLRFPKDDVQTWGVNFRRMIKRKNELALWTSWERDGGLTQLFKSGQLNGLRNLERGSLLEMKPYILGGVDDELARDIESNIKAGIDIKYPLTSNLTLDVTSFTDFAQVETDQTMINLTQYEIRYPEKRNFFLEGAEILQFGDRDITPFYSRTIGITPDNEQIPILGGAKITGKAGRYNIGILNMQTDSENGYPSTNYSVVRVKRDILEKSHFGFIATNLLDADKHTDRALGVDFFYATNKFMNDKNMEILADFAQNFKEDTDSGNRAGRIRIQFPNDFVRGKVMYQYVGENYEPEMGFVERTGIKQYETDLYVEPRPDLPYIKKLHFKPFEVNFFTDMSGEMVSHELEFVPFGITTTSEDNFTVTIRNEFENIVEEFNIFDEEIIDVGEYDWWGYELSLRTNTGRPLSLDIEYESGDFYNGEKNTFDTGLNYNFSKHFSLKTEVEYNDITLEGRNFATREYSLRFNTNISTRLNARTYVQWNNDDKLANVNFRIHYIPKIGSDVFFVYSHIMDGYRDYRTTYNTAIMKIAYRVTF